jgi:hypothetical protein
MAKSIVTIHDMNKRRGENWEFHYKNRELAKMFCVQDCDHVSNVIRQNVPVPVMLLDAGLLDGIQNVRGMNKALENLALYHMDRAMMCLWYWSAEEWQAFVREFQSLPEIYEDHYMLYDSELDAMRLVPLSESGNIRPKKYAKIRCELVANSLRTLPVRNEKRKRWLSAG